MHQIPIINNYYCECIKVQHELSIYLRILLHKPSFPKTLPPHYDLTQRAAQAHCYSQGKKGLKCVKTL